MKKGFTMIELIFVIVILGILAAVALPKLAATRDDAKLSSLVESISNIKKSVPSYALAVGTTFNLRDAADWSGWTEINTSSFSYGDVVIVSKENLASGEGMLYFDFNGTTGSFAKTNEDNIKKLLGIPTTPNFAINQNEMNVSLGGVSKISW